MKKLLLGLVLGASVAMANDLPTDDLLSVATQGKTAGSQFEMSKSEMKSVKGGYIFFQRVNYQSYGKVAYGALTETRYNRRYVIFARQLYGNNSGGVNVWVNSYDSNWRNPSYAYGYYANSLLAQYKNQILNIFRNN